MKTPPYPIFVITCCLLTCVSCTRGKQATNDFIFSVSDFKVPISCISSPSEKNDSILFIGFENGAIIRADIRTDERKVLSTDFNFTGRIYDIVQEEKDTFWLGVRNHGLLKFLCRKDSLLFVERYKIKYLNEHYSPYDIERDEEGTLVMGTSSGTFRLRKDERNNSLLTALYFPHESDRSKSVDFRVNQVKVYGNYVFCSTDSGLVILNKNAGLQNKKPFIGGKPFSHLYLDTTVGDTVLYATSDTMRYEINLTKSTIDSVRGENLFAYVTYAKPDTGHWEFTAREIRYSKNKDESLPLFTLPERMDKNYKNYLWLGKDFLFFSQGKKLYSLALHQNTKGKSNSVIAAHTITAEEKIRICYFITNDHYLYSMKKGSITGINQVSPDVSPLGSIENFSEGEIIIQMCCSENYLWFITDHNGLYKINLHPPFFKKHFTRTYEAVKDSLTDDFTCLFYDNRKNKNDLYVGSRKKLYKIQDPENSKEYRSYEIDSPENVLYVTDIVKYDDTVFCASLNYGLYEVKDTLLIKSDNKSLVALLCGSIFTNSKDNDKMSKSISFSFFKDDKNIFAFGYKGFGKLKKNSTIEGLRYLDMSFSKAAIANGYTPDNSILLGSQTGLYEYTYDDDHDNNNKLTLIEIPPPPSYFWYRIFSVAAIAVLFLLYFRFRYQKQHIKKGKEIITSIEVLINNKTEEITKIISDAGSKKEWEDILSEKAKTANEQNIEHSINYSFGLLKKILKFEKSYFIKTAITSKMTDSQKKDFEELRNLFITKEERKEGEKEYERQKREEEKRNRIKSKCEELLAKYRDELKELNLSNNTKKSYITLLFISGKYDNADIEATMNFSLVGSDRYIIHKNLKGIENRNALLEQLFENTKPKK